ncbi:MAG: ORF6N domain-containing protein [Planctomycetaceae bacterium]|nr:ORF6N domain-containing protein [Planctomycetaceae bacterium]
MTNDLIPIQDRIYIIRNQNVILDSDLAKLYEVETKVLNQAVKRNIDKFPASFMFQLTADEWKGLRSQIVTFKDDVRKFKPYAFTEHGVLMLANVLRSKKATAVSIRIVETFIKLRDYALTHVGLNEQISELRQLLMLHIDKTDHRLSEHDQTIHQIIQVLNNLVEQPRKTKKIGFRTN